MDTQVPVPPVRSGAFPNPFVLVKDSVVLFARHWQRFIGLVLIQFVPFVVWAVLTIGFGLIFRQTNSFLYANVYIVVFILGLIAASFVGYFCILAANQLALSVVRGTKSASMWEDFKTVRPMYWSVVWAVLLGGLATLGGLILFIVPGIILSLYLNFILPVVIDEKKKGLDALITSWNYMQGHWLELFAYAIVFWIFSVIVRVVVSLPIEFLNLGFNLGSLSAVNAHAPIVASPGYIVVVILSLLVIFIVQLVMIPIALIWSMKFYEYIKNSYVPKVEDNSFKRGVLISLPIFAILALIALATGISLMVAFLRTLPPPTSDTPTLQNPAVSATKPSNTVSTQNPGVSATKSPTVAGLVEFVSPQGDYAVKFPTKPETYTASLLLEGSDFPTPGAVYFSADDETSYQLFKAVFPTKPTDSKKVIDQLIAKIVSVNQGKLFASYPATFQGITDARRFEILGYDQYGAYPIKGIAFIKGTNMYALFSNQDVYSMNEFNDAPYNSFVASFRFLK